MAFAVFLGPFRHPNRLVQPTSLLGGLQAAPAVQRGPERGQPQSAAILPSPPGAPVRPHCLRGKEVLRIIQVRIFQSMQRLRRASGLMEQPQDAATVICIQEYQMVATVPILEVSCWISSLLSVDLLCEFKHVSPDE